MMTITVPVPVSPEEVARARREAIELEAKRQVEDVAKRNRDAGKAEPKPGTSLYVATARALPRRSRAGIMFSPTPIEVKVADGTDEEIEAKRKAGASVVSVQGAEEILADSNEPHLGLIVFGTKAEGDAAAVADAPTEALEAELARRKAGPATRDGAVERLSHSSRKATDKATEK